MTSNLTPTQIAQQALALSDKQITTFLGYVKPVTLFNELTISNIVKRTRYERVLETGQVTTHHGIQCPVETMADLLTFVERVAEITADDPAHKKFGELEVNIYDYQLEFDWDTSRPATAEELKEAADWLAANPLEPGMPIKWRPLTIPFRENIDNGDTNND